MFVIWIYAAAPKDLGQMSTKARETVENLTTKGGVVLGTYEVDQTRFTAALGEFRRDNFVAARDGFLRADPERRDARTQFYIAYSYYRQGFGKVYSDDELFKKGLAEVEKVVELDRDFKSDDGDLKLRTAAELKSEFEDGLRLTADDFNPFKLTRERK
ncbi:MAG: hypothetical protein IPK58_25790 [Acidobacteria bacterium]|nr:hypothetical protein [Acidobacteriota bacterium]